MKRPTSTSRADWRSRSRSNPGPKQNPRCAGISSTGSKDNRITRISLRRADPHDQALAKEPWPPTGRALELDSDRYTTGTAAASASQPSRGISRHIQSIRKWMGRPSRAASRAMSTVQHLKVLLWLRARIAGPSGRLRLSPPSRRVVRRASTSKPRWHPRHD